MKLISLLQVGSRQNVDSLADSCKVSRRTIFRDLDALREAGVPLIYQDVEQSYSLQGDYCLPPTDFTAEEALALIVLCHELGGKSGLPFYKAAQTAALKLESNLPSRLREHLREVSGAIEIKLQARNPMTGSEPIYQQLLRAVGRRHPVRIQYDSFYEGERIRTKLSPYRVLFSRRSWYCIGRSSAHRAVRTFNVNRILQLEILEETYEIPPRFNLDRHLGNAWRLIPEPGPDHEVHVRFQPLVARNVQEVAWHKTQRAELLPDGSLDFRVTVSGLGEISWWILGYGDQAEVIHPPELRQRIAERIARMAETYQVNSSDG
ncbi:MAG: transcriptional regulator [Planctomycetales bacterium]